MPAPILCPLPPPSADSQRLRGQLVSPLGPFRPTLPASPPLPLPSREAVAMREARRRNYWGSRRSLESRSPFT
jgi:hypothetical protein